VCLFSENKYGDIDDDVDDDGDAVPIAACPAGWSSYSSNCYWVSSQAVDWSAARADCVSKNADLVSISDSNEQQFVRSIS